MIGVLYRLYFHPLSKYPGPKLYQATNLIRIWYVLHGEWVHKVTAQHERYGPVSSVIRAHSMLAYLVLLRLENTAELT